MPPEFHGREPPAPAGEVTIDLVRLDAAIDESDMRASLHAAIGELAAEARLRATPPERLLVLIKSHLWARTTGLDPLARRELVDSSVRWAIEEYFRAR